MATKKAQKPTNVEMLEDYTKSYTDFLFETTQSAFDQTLALSERMMGMWMGSLKKAQELSIKESEAAFEMAETLQTQLKDNSEKVVNMMKDFSTN